VPVRAKTDTRNRYILRENRGSRPLAAFYLLALAALFPHLNHGFQSAFNTLGLEHPRYTPLVKGLGTAFAAVTVAGFASIVVYVGFCQGCVR